MTASTPGFLQSDGVEQPRRGLHYPGRPVAPSGMKGSAFDHQSTQLIKINVCTIFFAVPEGARSHQNRVWQLQRSQDGWSSQPCRSTSSAQNTGPSVQTRTYPFGGGARRSQDKLRSHNPSFLPTRACRALPPVGKHLLGPTASALDHKHRQHLHCLSVFPGGWLLRRESRRCRLPLRSPPGSPKPRNLRWQPHPFLFKAYQHRRPLSSLSQPPGEKKEEERGPCRRRPKNRADARELG